MSKVIDSFLVALGFELDKKSAKDAEKGIDEIRSNAIAMGAAFSGAFFGVDKAAKGANARIADLYDTAKRLEIAPKVLDAWGKATRMAGGEAEDLYSTAENINGLLADASLKGEGPWENLQISGVAPDFLSSSKDAIELLERLAEIYPRLSRDQKKFAAESLGLNLGTDKLLRAGPDQIDIWLVAAARFGLVTEDMGKASKKLQEASVNLDIAFTHLLDLFGSGAAEKMADAINDLADLLTEFKGLSEQASDMFGDNYGALATGATVAGTGAAIGVTGKAAGAIGMKGAASSLGFLGALLARVGLAGTSGFIGYKGAQYFELSEKIDELVRRHTGYESLGGLSFGYFHEGGSLLGPRDFVLRRDTVDEIRSPSNQTTVNNNQKIEITIKESVTPEATAKALNTELQRQIQNGIQQNQSGLRG